MLEATSPPAGFLGPFSESSGDGVGLTWSDYSWAFLQKWFSKSGGVIIFGQDAGKGFDVGFSMAGTKTTATVRGKQAEVLTYDRPFPGTIVSWQDRTNRYRLDGTGVTTADLVKMADAMREVTVQPQEPRVRN